MTTTADLPPTILYHFETRIDLDTCTGGDAWRVNATTADVLALAWTALLLELSDLTPPRIPVVSLPAFTIDPDPNPDLQSVTVRATVEAKVSVAQPKPPCRICGMIRWLLQTGAKPPEIALAARLDIDTVETHIRHTVGAPSGDHVRRLHTADEVQTTRHSNQRWRVPESRCAHASGHRTKDAALACANLDAA